jgi:quinol monooxygenase YgiN
MRVPRQLTRVVSGMWLGLRVLQPHPTEQPTSASRARPAGTPLLNERTDTMASTPAAPQILMIVTYEVADEDRDAFVRIAGAHAAASDSYPGCIRFSVGHDILVPGRFELIEQWQDQASLDAHGESEAFRRTSAALRECAIISMRPDRFELA